MSASSPCLITLKVRGDRDAAHPPSTACGAAVEEFRRTDRQGPVIVGAVKALTFWVRKLVKVASGPIHNLLV